MIFGTQKKLAQHGTMAKQKSVYSKVGQGSKCKGASFK
jgi:hypothetical protein